MPVLDRGIRFRASDPDTGPGSSPAMIREPAIISDGRAFPLFADNGGPSSNIKPDLIACLSERYGHSVTDADMLA